MNVESCPRPYTMHLMYGKRDGNTIKTSTLHLVHHALVWAKSDSQTVCGCLPRRGSWGSGSGRSGSGLACAGAPAAAALWGCPSGSSGCPARYQTGPADGCAPSPCHFQTATGTDCPPGSALTTTYTNNISSSQLQSTIQL